MLDKQAILGAQDLPQEILEIPEWGGSVIVRSMTGLERDEFEQSIYSSNGKSKAGNLRNIRARLVALTLIGEDGKRLFTAEEAEALGGKSAKALDRIFSVAQKLNGLSSNDVEEMAGNSVTE